MIETAQKDLVLVTGASGFLASHILKALVEQGTYRIRATVRQLNDTRKIEPLRKLFGDQIELVQADLLNQEDWKSAVQGCKFVIHTASPFPAQVPHDEGRKPASIC